jgi:hypothetical protein
MVPPIEVDADAIAAAKAAKLRDQIHRARTWQTIQRAIDSLESDMVLSPSMVNDIKDYASKRLQVIGSSRVVSKR